MSWPVLLWRAPARLNSYLTITLKPAPMKGRTVIMIAHRLSTLRDADKIIVLKDGVVAEEGNNNELIARGGVYADLHRIQLDAPTPSGTAH